VPDDDIRRKVLSVVSFLITRPSLSATRDEVIDAVWPDVDPASAVNSLNQTLYFLRRVFEPNYAEDLTPNYVHHDSDVIWLDEELVDSRSRRCRRLIQQISESGREEDVAALAREYKAKFALDFAYEEWASAYRETLHASYLETMEKAIVAKIEGGEPAHAIALLRRTLQVDPDAEQLERLLLRAYHDSGSHAALREQYAHYASFLRNELGIDPPDLQDLISGDFNLQ
jgi:DNA-binding SARP family transcriptional activator